MAAAAAPRSRKSRSAPKTTPPHEEVKRVRGTITLGSVQSGSVGTEDYTDSIQMSYAVFANTRLGKLMELYERWFFHSFSFKYVPIVDDSYGGSIELAYDWDPNDVVTGDSTALSSFANYRLGRVADECNLRVKNRRLADGRFLAPSLFTSPAGVIRTTSAGFLTVASKGVASDTTLGHIVMTYDVTLEIQQVMTEPYEPIDPGFVEPAIIVTTAPTTEWTTFDKLKVGSFGSGVADYPRLVYGSSTSPPTGDIDMAAGSVLTGKIGNLRGTARLREHATGKELGEGQTVYFEPVSRVETAAGTGTQALDTAHYIGGMFLDRMLTRAVDWFFATAYDGVIFETLKYVA